MEGFADRNLDWMPEVVVVGNICRRDHVEVLAAQQRGIRLTSFPAIVEELLFPTSCHLSSAVRTERLPLRRWPLPDATQRRARKFSYMIGGVPLNMGHNAAVGKGPHIVLEGDEYDCALVQKQATPFTTGPKSPS